MEPEPADLLDVDVPAFATAYAAPHARVSRLEALAARASAAIAVPALRAAVDCLRANSLDVQRHATVLARLAVLDPAFVAADAERAVRWAETAAAQGRSIRDSLDAQLATYKANLIKESIRMAHCDLAEHYYKCGDLASAMKCFLKCRDFCSTPKHVLDMCLSVLKVTVEQQNFSPIQAYVLKAESLPDPTLPISSTTASQTSSASNASDSARQLMLSKLKVYSALSHLDSAKYKAAAKSLLNITVPADVLGTWNEIMSPSDVAAILTLLTIATHSRTAIKSALLDNAILKSYLDTADPRLLHDVLLGFYSARYGDCLAALDAMRPLFAIDLYLMKHVEALIALIRRNAIVQYVVPFDVVDLHKMARAFNETSVKLVECELVGLISEGAIEGRIDSQNKVLQITKQDQRRVLYRSALKMGRAYAAQADFLVLRASMVKQDMFIDAPHSDDHRGSGDGGPWHSVDDDFREDHRMDNVIGGSDRKGVFQRFGLGFT
ncbi:hypothetical protein HDU83_007420 [Entophlyctis luteolus]|nr:hypothetical protein HDU83_007420 [Entophlyctis luteolus]